MREKFQLELKNHYSSYIKDNDSYKYSLLELGKIEGILRSLNDDLHEDYFDVLQYIRSIFESKYGDEAQESQLR